MRELKGSVQPGVTRRIVDAFALAQRYVDEGFRGEAPSAVVLLTQECFRLSAALEKVAYARRGTCEENLGRYDLAQIAREALEGLI